MKHWSDIKTKLDDSNKVAIQLLLLLLGAYAFIMSQDHIQWKIPILFFGFLIWFFFRDKTKHPIIWLVFFILLLCDLFIDYFWLANHHFMLTFVVLSVIAYMYHDSKGIIQKNIQIILMLVILTSVLQKLMSQQFMNGSFYYFMINKGTLFRFFINFFPESLEVVKNNSESLMNLKETNPNNGQKIIFKDLVPNLAYISLVFARITVAFEFVVAMAILWKPKSILTHILIIIMILGILCARLETGFMALLTICGLFLCKNIKLKLVYVAIALGCITFIVTKYGYH